MERMDVLWQIELLIQKRRDIVSKPKKTAADKKEKNKIDKELAKWGQFLESPHRNEKIKAIIEKGDDATMNDIQYLYQNDYTLKQIAEKLGLDYNQFRYLIRKFDIELY